MKNQKVYPILASIPIVRRWRPVKSLSLVSFLLLLMSLTTVPALAGILTIKDVGEGTKVTVYVKDPKGEWQQNNQHTADKNGVVKFGLGSLEEEKKIHSVMIDLGGGYGEVELNPNGVTVADVEPFRDPLFTHADPTSSLVTVVDMVSLLHQGDPFFVGEQLSVTNGSIPGVPSITVHFDTQPLSDNFTQTFIDQLPLYTGTTSVQTFADFTPAPEPSSLLLVGSGALAVSGLLRRRLRTRS